MARRALIASCGALALSACATGTPPPAIEVRTQRVEVPVPVPCVDKSAIPTKPGKISNTLTGDAAHDLDLVTAQALRLGVWGDSLAALLIACTK
jgi:hypothetical protein